MGIADPEAALEQMREFRDLLVLDERASRRPAHKRRRFNARRSQPYRQVR